MDTETAPITSNSENRQETYLCRIATILLNAGTHEDVKSYPESVRAALEADPRVTYAKFLFPRNLDFIDSEIFYPHRGETVEKDILWGSDAFNAVSFDQPIFFKISVPIKNQPKFHGMDDIPTDSYWVAWNGIATFVLWKHQSNHIPASGGHIALEILEDAATKCGLSAYNQACTPGCQNVFIHCNILAQPDHNVDDFEIRKIEDTTITAAVPELATELETARTQLSAEDDAIFHIAYSLQNVAVCFSLRKNIGRRLADLDSITGLELTRLLADYSGHAEIAALPLLAHPKKKWDDRGWRRHARLHSARVWLGASAMEALIHSWHEQDSDFSQGNGEGISAIFAEDGRQDGVAVSAINISRLTDICAQVEKRFDAGVLSWATAGGAVAGAIPGSLVTLFH